VLRTLQECEKTLQNHRGWKKFNDAKQVRLPAAVIGCSGMSVVCLVEERLIEAQRDEMLFFSTR